MSLITVAFWVVIVVVMMAEDVEGYFNGYYNSKLNYLSSKLPLKLNCSDGVPIPPVTIIKSFSRGEERQVLQKLYLETAGYNWTINYGWNSSHNGTGIDHCHWPGVTCDKQFGYVIGLSVNNNNLRGRVPNFLWKLRNLMLLCLPHNPYLYGEVRNFVYHNMSRLLRIDLAFCSLTGNLSNNLFLSLQSLVKLQLCCQKHKGIDGSIPPSIVDLKNLRVLSLGENRLRGEIPKAIGKLKKVWFLDLEFMSLSGNISIFLGMKSLEEMHLTQAGIKGDIPDNFGSQFPRLNECQLRNNSITGFIPTSVNKMKNLTKLILCGNHIQGTLSKELIELPLLRILDLSHNNLQIIEDGILDFNGSPKLEILLLHNNPRLSAGFDDLVSALIPKDPIQNPSALRILDISHCDFAGKMSPLIWMLPSLIEMNLKQNRIGGRIPEVLDDIMFLTYIDFSENQLEGPIPDTFVLLQSLWVFDIRKNPSMGAPTAGINESSGVIQDLMRIDPNSRMKGDSYTCPFAKFLSNNGSILLDPSYYYSKFCVCDHGFFGHLGRCKKCISGGDCPNKSSIDVNPNIYLNIKKGYWPCPSADNATHLIRCPGRMTVDKDSACNPSGHCRCWLNTTDLRTVCNKSCICHSGNTDRLCSKCEKGYFKNGYLCNKCSESSSLSPYIAIPIVICCLLFLWGVFRFCQERIKVKFSVVAIEFIILISLQAMQVISGWIFEVSIVLLLFYMAGIMKNTRGLVTILVFHFQVLDAVISSTQTSLPDFLFSIQHYMSSIFNLNFPGISCSLPILFTPQGKYLVIILFPLGCLLIIWTYYGIRVMTAACLRVDQRQYLETVKFQCQKVTISCLVLTYFPIVKHSLTVISPCDKDEDTGSFMRVAPWIMCDSNNTMYETLKILGWLSVIIYGVFVPAIFFSLLRWYTFNKNQFSDDQKKLKLCDSWLGAIYLPYEDNVQSYFEVMKLARKLVIAGLLTFIPNTSSIQTFTIAFLLMAAVVYQLEFKPYAKHEAVNFENSLETLSLVVLQQSVILLRFTSYDTESSEGLIWIVIAVNALVLVAFMVAVPSVLINLCSASEPVNETTPLLADGQTAKATDT